MTVVIYSDGVVAADGRLCVDQMIITDSWVKIRELKNNLGYVAFAGSIGYLEPMKEWIEAGAIGPRPKHDESYSIVFGTDGVIREYEFDHGFIINDPQYPRAWGSGTGYALAALHAGATPYEAIKIAAKCCNSVGGLIQNVDLTHLPGFARFALKT